MCKAQEQDSTNQELHIGILETIAACHAKEKAFFRTVTGTIDKPHQHDETYCSKYTYRRKIFYGVITSVI